MKLSVAFLSLSLVAAAATPVMAVSADEEKDVVTAELDKCLETPEGQTTSGMVECTHNAYLAYDKQLNDVYKKALASVDKESADKIRESQRKWIAWRDAQRAADSGAWRADRGTLASLDIESFNVDAIKARVQQLQYYVSE
ncbi:lysozyme inhibitor LprI family protein [Phyllobacterium sp. SB3]|uniref:lysozyme inhibitor LprI family protein n=1 Tax=Phyllobacterium sp. SB3 TaxID=3156073 RepID=UPI0032AEC9F3